ncbi:MAG: hypothetical protein NBV60_02610 [Erythrobacter sp.]|nr:hypothetical protein [Erythrobacter sp.]
MRTALIAAIKRTDSGALRAGLPLAGRSVLARQVDLLRMLGCERILCLCESADAEVLRAQQAVEAAGGTFQALRGFLHLPALVRAEDELVILADGLLPDPALVQQMFADTPASSPRFVASLPSDSPLVAQHPEDFERIDAARHWAGLLVMRGASVQHLADFPPDADAISLLLRLALQAGTPCREVSGGSPAAEAWLLASDETALAAQGQALIFRAAGAMDWRKPSAALAGLAARALAPRGLANGPLLAMLGAAVFGLGGMAAASWGWAASGLAFAAIGALAAAFVGALGAIKRELLGEGLPLAQFARLRLAVDTSAAATLLLALSPAGSIAPLAALGPVALGLARLTPPASPLAMLTDRGLLLALLALAAAFALLSHATALVSLVLLGGLLLPQDKNRG